MISCKSDKKGVKSNELETNQTALAEIEKKDPQQILSRTEIKEDITNPDSTKVIAEAKFPPKEIKKEEPQPKKEVEELTITKPKTKKKKPKPTKVVSHKKPKIQFEELVWNFGEITEGDIIEKKFKFVNTGNAPLEIIATSATCGCTRPSFPFLDIAPGKSNVIGVTYNSVGKDGEQDPEITIESNTVPKITILKLHGTVKPKPKKEVIPDSSVSVKDSIVLKQ